MKLASVFSEIIHGRGCSVGNCSVCADLMEKGKSFGIIPNGIKALSPEESLVCRTPSLKQS